MSNNLSAALQAIAQQNKPIKDQITLTREKLQESIRNERLSQNLTQRKLAHMASMSQSSITRAEKHGWISLWALLKIASALNKQITLN